MSRILREGLFFLGLLFCFSLKADDPNSGRPYTGSTGQGSAAQQAANNNILQTLKNTEQESNEALKVTYKDLDTDKATFNKPQENQTDSLTILRKSSH